MKTPLRTLVATLGLLAALVPGVGQAAVLVTTSTVAPSSSFASSTTQTSGVQWRNDTANGRRDVGQSFQATSNLTLDSVTFRIAADAAPGSGAPNASFTLSLYQVNSAGAFPSSSAILTETGTLTGLTDTSASWNRYVTFDLTNTVLTSGNYYAVMLAFDSPAAARNLVWQVGPSGSYSGGQSIITTDGISYSSFGGGSDLVFYATAVPEPTAAAFGLFGVGLVAWRSRRCLA